MSDETTTTNNEPKSSGSSNTRRDRSSRSQSRSSRPPQRYGRNFRSRRKVCAFCVDKVKTISWKDYDSLRRFINDDGSIRARRKTGTCARHQRRLAIAIKRARHMALLPFTGEHVRLYGSRN